MGKETLNKIIKIVNKFIYLITPIIVLVLFLIYSKINNLYPLGENSIAWCDMNQQVIPLFNQFKDILSGKASFTYNFENAGGMSFFGVFFFFLSSPFTLLIGLVSKSDVPLFMNILVMLKMMMASLTIGIYFKKKYENLNSLILIGLSLMYSFSGYILMYYQNVIWLDIVYLFPLLILSIDSLIHKNKIVPYIIMTSLLVMINYYLGIIVIFYVLIYVSLNIYINKDKENIKYITFRFIMGSFISALISMVVLIPSFIDYLNSARTVSIKESLESSWVMTSYVTTIPLILSTLILIPFFFNKTEFKNEKSIKLILLGLLSIPLLIDPINKMWHFGSYQAFPCRFSFINTFLFLDIISLSLESKEDIKYDKKNLIKLVIGYLISICVFIGLFIFENLFIKNKFDSLVNYSRTLWGNNTSFEALLRYYGIIFLGVLIIFTIYKLKFLTKKSLGLTLITFALLDSMFSFKIYVANPSNSVDSYKDYYYLENVIQDDSFYRVKTDYKIRNVNDLGGLGYYNLGHYTSLTSENYMNTIKKLGYSSYWMEVGSNGGTSFTDALLLNKYTIKRGNYTEAKYTSGTYSVFENEVFPLGIVTSRDLSKDTTLNNLSRVEAQEKIYDYLVNDELKLHTIYSPSLLSSSHIKEEDNQLSVTSGTLSYSINITSKTKLYFEAINEYKPLLKQSIHEKISIRCNSKTIQSSYPSQSSNGTIYLGEYENETVNVTIQIKSDLKCSSFNVFGINSSLLTSKINEINHASIEYKNFKFIGNYESSLDSEYLFLPISYNQGIKAKVNSKNVKVEKVFDDFVAIKLTKGNNQIEIYFTQKGFVPGLLLTILGLISLGVVIFVDKKKINYSNKIVNNISYYLVYALGILVIFVIYVLPLFINVGGQLK